MEITQIYLKFSKSRESKCTEGNIAPDIVLNKSNKAT